jgi:hypothetical protein
LVRAFVYITAQINYRNKPVLICLAFSHCILLHNEGDLANEAKLFASELESRIRDARISRIYASNSKAMKNIITCISDLNE